MPKDYPDPKNAGTIRCLTPEQQAEAEQFYRDRKEAARQAEREKLEAARRKEEERKEAARRKVEDQREAARRKEQERKEAIAKAEEAKRQAEVKRLQEQHAVARQKVSEQLKQSLEKQRLLELQKAAQAKQQELQRAAPPRQFNFTECQLIEMANGANSQRAKSNCNLKYLETRSGAPSPTPAPPPAAGTISPEQLEELRRKAVSLQPEQRKIAPTPPAVTAKMPPPLSTFVCGTPPNQYPCPPAASEPPPLKTPPSAAEEPESRNPFFDGKAEKSPSQDSEQAKATAKTLEQICVTTTETCRGRRFAPPDTVDGSIRPPTSWLNSRACKECVLRVNKTCKERWGPDDCTEVSNESCEDVNRPIEYVPPEPKTICHPLFK